MIEPFLFHLIGDYITQNNWMANTKTKNSWMGYLACLIHCILYTIPFLLITTNPTQVGLIFGTHFIIDKYRLSVYWIKFVNCSWKSTNYGYMDSTPVWMSTWLMIIVDNVIHICINYSVLKYF